MLKFERVMEALSDSAQRRVAFNVYRIYGGPLTGAERSALYRKRHELDTGSGSNGVPNALRTSSRPTREISSRSLEPKNKNRELREQATEVLAFLNEKAGKHFRYVEANLKLITARLQSGASVSDCKAVVARKNREWNKVPEDKAKDMRMYLRPATLFAATNFEQYLGEMEPENGLP